MIFMKAERPVPKELRKLSPEQRLGERRVTRVFVILLFICFFTLVPRVCFSFAFLLHPPQKRSLTQGHAEVLPAFVPRPRWNVLFQRVRAQGLASVPLGRRSQEGRVWA